MGGGGRQRDGDAVPGAVGQARRRHRPLARRTLPRPAAAPAGGGDVAGQRGGGDGDRPRGVLGRGDRVVVAAGVAAAGRVGDHRRPDVRAAGGGRLGVSPGGAGDRGLGRRDRRRVRGRTVVRAAGLGGVCAGLGGAPAAGAGQRHHRGRRDRGHGDAARDLPAQRPDEAPRADRHRRRAADGAAVLVARGGGGAKPGRSGQHGDGGQQRRRVPRRALRRGRDRDRLSHPGPGARRRGGGGVHDRPAGVRPVVVGGGHHRRGRDHARLRAPAAADLGAAADHHGAGVRGGGDRRQRDPRVGGEPGGAELGAAAADGGAAVAHGAAGGDGRVPQRAGGAGGGDRGDGGGADAKRVAAGADGGGGGAGVGLVRSGCLEWPRGGHERRPLGGRVASR